MADASDDPTSDDGLLPMELYPNFNVRCALFEGVSNATELVQQCVKGEIKGDLALIDADRVVSVRVLRQAATNCARAGKQGRGTIGAVKSHDLPRGRTTGADLVRAPRPPLRWAAPSATSARRTRRRGCWLRGLFLSRRVPGVGRRADGRRVPLALDARSDAAQARSLSFAVGRRARRRRARRADEVGDEASMKGGGGKIGTSVCVTLCAGIDQQSILEDTGRSSINGIRHDGDTVMHARFPRHRVAYLPGVAAAATPHCICSKQR